MTDSRARSRIGLLLAALALAGLACGEGAAPTSDPAAPSAAATGAPPAVAADAAEAQTHRPTNEDLFAERIEQAGRGLTPAEEGEALRQFMRVWAKYKPVFASTFLGVRTMQNPLDAWVVQEVISEVRPDVFVECGTAFGGSALLWAMILENVVPDAEVITIDIEDRREPAARTHRLADRVRFLLGSSTDPAIVEEVRRQVEGKRVMVLLDSLHTKEHIAAELAAYAPMVSVGSYIVVQDSWFGGAVAVDEYVAAHPDYEIDRTRERFRLTNSIRGYVKRVR